MEGSWEIRETHWPEHGPTAMRAIGDGGELAWLDSAVSGPRAAGDARYSLICADPLAVLEQFDHQPARLTVGGRCVAEDDCGWALWRRIHRLLPTFPPVPWSVSPGWVGYVGFEMARQLERLPASHRDDLGLPLMRMALFDRGTVLDHSERRVFDVTASGLADAVRTSHSRSSVARRGPTAPGSNRATARDAAARLCCELSRAEYERMVGRALEYIAAGDIYQVNLAQRLRIEGVRDVLVAYAAVRESNPAPYAALLRWDGGAVASFSPELFLRLRGEDVLTRPIKGTRPRTGDPTIDERHRRDLLASEKEAAELAMIIDLHRNDLGRVCRYGSVKVTHPRRVEAHPTVFHTVADVAGRLKPEHDGIDLLAACFPAGSISGVPKIRALQIIDELEPAARGVYTGAIGVLGLDGQMTFNVAIRTLQIRGQTATLHVGGGIVADSDPAAEYEETLAKARGILNGLVNGESRVADGADQAAAGAGLSVRG